MDLVIGLIIVIIIVFWLINSASKPKSKKQLNEEALKIFGDTKEERFKNIIAFFDKKMGKIECDIDYKYDIVRVRQSFERNLKTLNQSERDALVTAYLLYNEDFMGEQNFFISRFALLYGEGSGQAVSSKKPKFGEKDIRKLPDSAHGQQTLSWLLNYMSISSQGVLSLIYRTLEDSLEKYPDNATLKYLNKRLSGLHIWSTQDDLAGSIYTTDITKGYRLGALIENEVGFEETDIPVNYDEGMPVMAYAPTGEGKTQCFALPNLLTWRGACIVLDVKGELYEKTSQWRSLNIGPVYRFNPLNPDDSLRFNPLNEIRDDPNFVFQDARKIAWHMIITKNANEPHWEDSAREFLAAGMAVVAEGAPVGQRDFNKVLDIITGHNMAQFVAQLKQHSDAGMRRVGLSLESSMNQKELNSILSAARTGLSGWDSNNIQKVTSGQNDWSTAAFRSENQGERPPTLYIEINPAEIEQYQSLIRTVLGMHFDRLYDVQPAHDKKRDVLFILDEMPTLNYMKPIEKAFSTGRSYGISLFAIAQSKKQLDVAYPQAEAMMTNAAVRLYMSPKMADGTAKEVSDELGVKSTQGEMTEPNVRPEILAQGEYDDKIIALGSNSKPILLKRQYAHADENLKSKMGQLPTYAMKAKANQGHYQSEDKLYQKDLQVIKGQKTKENLKKLEAIAKPVNPLRRRPKDKKQG